MSHCRVLCIWTYRHLQNIIKNNPNIIKIINIYFSVREEAESTHTCTACISSEQKLISLWHFELHLIFILIHSVVLEIWVKAWSLNCQWCSEKFADNQVCEVLSSRMNEQMQNCISICPVVVENLQSGLKWWTDRQVVRLTGRLTLPSLEPGC